MNCTSCRHKNRPTAKFCADCGAKLQRICSQCGSQASPDDRFCDACGAALAAPTTPTRPQAPSLEAEFTTLQQAMPATLREQILTPSEGENRIVTVLFADMSRSVEATRDLPPDEGAALVNYLLRAMVDVLVTHDGRVDRFLGDGVLAVFGATQAHENDSERAIRAALEIRRAATDLGLEVTAGINTGDVYVGGMGSEQHQEVTVMGLVVNLAARLQQQASPGEVIVGQATYRHTRRAFEFAPRVLSLKGIGEAITAYTVLRPLPRPEKARGIDGLWAPLIGRERELTALTDAADALIQERVPTSGARRVMGQIVAVVGDAGIGKTRLVSELKAHLQPAQVTWLEGRCIAIGQSASFWPFIDLVRAYLGLLGEAGEQEAAGRLIEKLTDLFPETAEGIIPYVGQMLSLRLEERYQERLRYASPEQVRRQTLLRMRDLFVALARRHPLVLILEDLHWADDLSLDLLWLLMDELVAAPILLVCIYRPEREHGCWKIDSVASSKHRERYTPIRLQPLTRGESQQMVEALLSLPNLPAETQNALLGNTEGNPFFVEEVVRLLIDRGIIYQEEGRWNAREGIGVLTVPDTVKSVILSRIDRLEREVKQVLQCASVIGRVFQHRLLTYLSDRQGALERHLKQLESQGLVFQERTIPELEYAFKHVLTQETTYETILSRQRKLLHGQVAAAIETLYPEQREEYYELLAFHYSRSENGEKAIEYLGKAAQKAAARYANQEALSYYERALNLTEGTARYDAILARRARLYTDLYRGQESARDYERLLASARQRQDRALELEALLGLAAAYYVIALDDPLSHSPARSYELFGEAYQLARELGDKVGMAQALLPARRLANCGQGSDEEVRSKAEEALALSQEIGDEELIIDCKLDLGADVDDLLAQLEARHDLRRLKYAYYRLLMGRLFGGDYEQAIEYCNISIRLASEIGVPPVLYPSQKAMALLGLGRYGEAWSALEEEVADTAHLMGAGMKDLMISNYYLDLMAFERAAEVARRPIELGPRLSRLWMHRWGQILLTSALLRAGKLDAATLAGISDELQAAGRPLPGELLAEAALAEGRLDEALQHAENAIAEHRNGNQNDYVIALEMKLRALTRLDRAVEAVEVAEEALRIADERHYLPLEWRLREAKALGLTALGDTEAASREYQTATAIIRALAETIEEAELREGYLANSQVAAILTAAPVGRRAEE